MWASGANRPLWYCARLTRLDLFDFHQSLMLLPPKAKPPGSLDAVTTATQFDSNTKRRPYVCNVRCWYSKVCCSLLFLVKVLPKPTLLLAAHGHSDCSFHPNCSQAQQHEASELNKRMVWVSTPDANRAWMSFLFHFSTCQDSMMASVRP